MHDKWEGTNGSIYIIIHIESLPQVSWRNISFNNLLCAVFKQRDIHSLFNNKIVILWLCKNGLTFWILRFLNEKTGHWLSFIYLMPFIFSIIIPLFLAFRLHEKHISNYSLKNYDLSLRISPYYSQHPRKWRDRLPNPAKVMENTHIP